MEQHVGIGPNQLVAEDRFGSIVTGDEFGVVAPGATSLIEQLLATQYVRVLHIPAHRHSQTAGVEQQLLHQFIGDLRSRRVIRKRVSMRCIPAIGLRLGAITIGGVSGKG